MNFASEPVREQRPFLGKPLRAHEFIFPNLEGDLVFHIKLILNYHSNLGTCLRFRIGLGLIHVI